MLHDTEIDGSADAIVDSWLSEGDYVAAHFIVERDGDILQVVELDAIAHHAGFGDLGHNTKFSTPEDGRDDRRGTTPVGNHMPDYGMNSYSIGIEMVHVSGGAPYTARQLDALDGLIAYIDTTTGTRSDIIDHKTWRSGNSDTSAEFADHLSSYRKNRLHAPLD